MSLSTNDATQIVLTDNAAAKVYSLICEENNHQLMLRAFITGGGCSGFQYGFTFDEQVGEGDAVVEKIISMQAVAEFNSDVQADSDAQVGVKLLVDPISFQYLKGAEIDYKIDDKGQQFVIRNPNAKTTCGCGASFAA